MTLLKPSGRWGLALALVVLAAPARAATVDPYLPNDSQAVLTVNVRQVLGAPLVRKNALDFIKAFLKSKDEVQQVLTDLGFDPLTDLDSVTAAFSGSEPDKNLGIFHGKFDTAKFRAKADQEAKDHPDALTIHSEGGRTVYEVNAPADPNEANPKPLYVALLDGSTLVASQTRSYVDEALDKKAGKVKSEIDPKLQTLLEKADTSQSFSVAALGSGLGKGPLGNNEDVKKLVSQISTVKGGFTVADDVRIDFVIAAKDATGAQELAKAFNDGLDQVRGMLSILANERKGLNAVVDALEVVKVNAEGTDVTIKGRVTPDMLEKALKKPAAQ